jgi:hypothetical protein
MRPSSDIYLDIDEGLGPMPPLSTSYDGSFLTPI